jgi:hypothetical protein
MTLKFVMWMYFDNYVYCLPYQYWESKGQGLWPLLQIISLFMRHVVYYLWQRKVERDTPLMALVLLVSYTNLKPWHSFLFQPICTENLTQINLWWLVVFYSLRCVAQFIFLQIVHNLNFIQRDVQIFRKSLLCSLGYLTFTGKPVVTELPARSQLPRIYNGKTYISSKQFVVPR